ncbi:MAG: hypothetical protein ABMA64_28905 [Myxococcota bacterium]
MLKSKRCAKCGSTPVVHVKKIPDHHGSVVGSLRLVHQGAWGMLSRGSVWSDVQLVACKRCGYAELYVHPSTPWEEVPEAELLTATP